MNNLPDPPILLDSPYNQAQKSSNILKSKLPMTPTQMRKWLISQSNQNFLTRTVG